MNLIDFKARFPGGGARPNLFEVVVAFPTFAGGNDESRTLSFLCKGASLPASTLGTIEVPYQGMQFKVAGDRTFEPWEITVLNDTDFKLKNAFEKWSAGIHGHSSNVGFNPAEYMTDLEVHQLGRNGEILAKYVLRSAYPESLAAVDLAFDTNDTTEEFTVTFQYQYWERPDDFAL